MAAGEIAPEQVFDKGGFPYRILAHQHDHWPSTDLSICQWWRMERCAPADGLVRVLSSCQLTAVEELFLEWLNLGAIDLSYPVGDVVEHG